MKFLCILLTIWATFAHATVRPRPGVYRVTGMLTLYKSSNARFHVNPLSRLSYTFLVQNPDTVAKLLGKTEFIGQVEVELKVLNANEYQASAEIKKVRSIHVKRLPVYDGALEVVDNRDSP